MLALAIIGVFIALQVMPELFLVAYLIGLQTDIAVREQRDYGSDVKLLHVYFVTSPMLAICHRVLLRQGSLGPPWQQARGALGAARDQRARPMLLAGTRNNILVSILLPAALVFYYARNKVVGALVKPHRSGCPRSGIRPALEAFLNPSETSNSTKLAMVDDTAVYCPIRST